MNLREQVIALADARTDECIQFQFTRGGLRTLALAAAAMALEAAAAGCEVESGFCDMDDYGAGREMGCAACELLCHDLANELKP